MLPGLRRDRSAPKRNHRVEAAASTRAAVWRPMNPAVRQDSEVEGKLRTSCRLWEGLKRDLVAKLCELRDKTFGFDLGRPAVEVVGP